MTKDKYIILQRIRIRASAKQRLRIKRRSDRNCIYSSNGNSDSVRPPRKFMRQNRECINDSNKKPDYLSLKKSLMNSSFGKRLLPKNLKYLLCAENSPFNLADIRKKAYKTDGSIMIPKEFSIINNPIESYETLRMIISAFFVDCNYKFKLDYINCTNVEIGTQVLLDIILIDANKFVNAIYKNRYYRTKYIFPWSMGAVNVESDNVKKMLSTIGSPVNLKLWEKDFSDVIKYKLCIFDKRHNKLKDSRKEIDTTKMAVYVEECLAKMNKRLTPQKRDDLCTVIGEILINAEEHSTTDQRFSIGYFKDEVVDDKHSGIFRLVILNFGESIYEKFKSEECANVQIVTRMKKLSDKYTTRLFFLPGKFEEENLWTLYALQEGVTSVDSRMYSRGNGSINFINSFFNIKGSSEHDNVSRLNIISGKTRIWFDGTYKILNKTDKDGNKNQVMTFNESGDIVDKPDDKYVHSTKYHFPGTMISAKILLNDDDIQPINN